MASAEIEISFYNFMNPHQASDIEVEIEDRVRKFDLEKIEEEFRSIYRLKLHDLEEFGIDITADGISNRKAVNDTVQDLITSINLTTLTGAATRQIGRIERPKIEYTSSEKEEIGEQTYAEMRNKNTQPISEEAVMDIFQKIRLLDRKHLIGSSDLHMLSSGDTSGPDLDKFIRDADIPENFAEINLRKALLAYDGAMNSWDKSIQHILLFIALETATDNDDYESRTELKEAISDVSEIDIEYIDLWNELYNRQKHVDSNEVRNDLSQEEMKKMSVAGLTNKGLHLHGMRKAAASAIQTELNSIS